MVVFRGKFLAKVKNAMPNSIPPTGLLKAKVNVTRIENKVGVVRSKGLNN